MKQTVYLRITKPKSHWKTTLPSVTAKEPPSSSIKPGQVVVKVQLEIPDSYFNPIPTLSAIVEIPERLKTPEVTKVVIEDIESKFEDALGLKLTIKTFDGDGGS